MESHPCLQRVGEVEQWHRLLLLVYEGADKGMRVVALSARLGVVSLGAVSDRGLSGVRHAYKISKISKNFRKPQYSVRCSCSY